MLQPGTAFVSLIYKDPNIYSIRIFLCKPGKNLIIEKAARMKKLSVIFLYCYLMALTLIELLNSQFIRLIKGRHAFEVKRS